MRRRYLLVAAVVAILVALFALPKCKPETVKVVPTPHTPQPTPVQTYRVFLPAIGKSPRVSKKGLAALGAPEDICADAAQLGVTWLYQWWGQPTQCPGIETIPMTRDANQVNDPIADSPYLLLFNEPDLCPEQACLTVAEALLLHRRVEELHPDRLLIAPVPSQLAPNWIRGFRAAYRANYGEYPKWHALATHCYFTNEQMMQNCIALVRQYIGDANAWGVNQVWVTEFSAVAAEGLWNLDQAAEAEKRFIAFLDGAPTVKRYAHFTNRVEPGLEPWCSGCEPLRLFDNSGVKTPLGRMYAESKGSD